MLGGKEIREEEESEMIQEFDINTMQAFEIGHGDHPAAGTGCTVILAKAGAVPGVSVQGGAPGTRETDLIRSEEMVQEIHAVLLSGGSAYGLDAASGVMRYLEEEGIGFDVGVARVPIVAGAVLFDLAYRRADIRPDGAMGHTAASAAPLRRYTDGSVGAGCGATVGKILGPDKAMKSGIGACALRLGDLEVAAVVAVNAFGTVLEGGKPLAGPYAHGILHATETLMLSGAEAAFPGNTTIGCILTNARLDKAGANKVAAVAHDGLARTIRPVHTMVDGDTLFVLAKGTAEADRSLLSTLAALAVERAVVRAVKSAEDDLLPTWKSLQLRKSP